MSLFSISIQELAELIVADKVYTRNKQDIIAAIEKQKNEIDEKRRSYITDDGYRDMIRNVKHGNDSLIAKDIKTITDGVDIVTIFYRKYAKIKYLIKEKKLHSKELEEELLEIRIFYTLNHYILQVKIPEIFEFIEASVSNFHGMMAYVYIINAFGYIDGKLLVSHIHRLSKNINTHDTITSEINENWFFGAHFYTLRCQYKYFARARNVLDRIDEDDVTAVRSDINKIIDNSLLRTTEKMTTLKYYLNKLFPKWNYQLSFYNFPKPVTSDSA